jgi:hypothetical protein
VYHDYEHRLPDDKYQSIKAMIIEVFDASNKTYGYRRLKLALKNFYDVTLAYKTVRKLMKELHLVCKAKEAVDLYISAFPVSKILHMSFYPNRAEEGLADFQMNLADDVLTVEFELSQQRFVAINAGPEFKFNPSVSFMVNFDLSSDAIYPIFSLLQTLSCR